MGIERQWIINEPADHEKVERLAAELGIDKVLAGLLVRRGIETFEDARAFFRPSLDNLHDPFLMKDMDKAVERLRNAIVSNEKILVYGDYDVDGTTAVALVYSFLKRFAKTVGFYIPDRYEEGYGLSRKGIDYAKKEGFSLLIVLDCGIKAAEKVRYASDKGVDIIICDHHLPDEDAFPAATAVLDPKRSDCGYPFKDLSGCGIGFKLVCAYSQRYGIDFRTLEPLMDLLAVSITTDLVSVTGENRILAHYGLKRLNEDPCKGLLAMMNVAKLEPGHITIDEIAFKIGPRINAAGRMDSGKLAVELLTADNDKKALDIADKINADNNERKKIDMKITAEALGKVDQGLALASDNVTIVYDPSWEKGVVGIVASRLVEAYYKPAIVLTKSNGFVTGSARSIQGFDLYAAIESCADLLETFGGHLYAAGLTLKEENLDEFCRRTDEFVASHMTPETAAPVINADAKLDFSRITPKFSRILKLFQPFGPGNANPVFVTEEVYDAGNGRKVGENGNHMKLDLMQENAPYHQIAAMAFNMSKDFYEHIHNGNPIDICYTIVENFYRGSSTTQLRIKDIRKGKDFIIE